MIIQKFFWLCSGGRISLIRENRSLHNLYAGLGAFVFFTSLFAFLSFFYASGYLFQSIYIRILLSLLWGAFIFNLDRFLVSSLDEINKNNKILIAIPRILIAIFLALIISKPLELKLFENEIDENMALFNQSRRVQYNQSLNSDSSEIGLINSSIEEIKSEIDKKEKELMALSKRMIREIDGSGGTEKIGAGPVYKAKKREYLEFKQEWIPVRKSMEIMIDSLESRKLIAIRIADNHKSDFENLISSNLGIIDRLDALHRLKNSSDSIYWAGTLIFLLFVFIESSPVIFKLLSPESFYAYMFQNEKRVLKTENDIQTEDKILNLKRAFNKT